MNLTEGYMLRLCELAGLVTEQGRIDFLKGKFKEWADEHYQNVAKKKMTKVFRKDSEHPEGGIWQEKPAEFLPDLAKEFKGKLPDKDDYDGIVNKIFKKLLDSDPSHNKQYLQWIIRMFTTGSMPLEDTYKATEYLQLYDKVKQKMPVEYRDINKFKSLPDLYEKIAPYEKVETMSREEQERAKKLEGADRVYEDSRWLVIHPKTSKAACLYGKETKWCTTSGSFEYYNRQGPLFILFDKSIDATPRENPMKKLQFHFESNQFMNAIDKPLEDIGEFFRSNPKLLEKFIEIGKVTEPFRLKHKLMPKEEVRKILLDPKKRMQFVDDREFGAEWIMKYLHQIGELDELRNLLTKDTQFLKKLLDNGNLSVLKTGFALLGKNSNRLMADTLYNNKTILDYFRKNPRKDALIEEYMKLLSNAGDMGKKYAWDMYVDTDTMYDIFKKNDELSDYYIILQKASVFGDKGAAIGLKRLSDKKSRYRKEYIDEDGKDSYDIILSYMKELFKEGRVMREVEMVASLSKSFIDEGRTYLRNIGFAKA